jgi:hypothetical protein
VYETTDPPALRAIVRKRRVCYEIHPSREMTGEGPRDVGFQVELYGTVDGRTPSTPEGACALEVYADLARIAHAVAPVPGRAFCQVKDFDNAIHSAPLRSDRSEVRLVLAIEHAERWDAPVDAAERGCLDQITQALRNIGARPDRWEDAPDGV